MLYTLYIQNYVYELKEINGYQFKNYQSKWNVYNNVEIKVIDALNKIYNSIIIHPK